MTVTITKPAINLREKLSEFERDEGLVGLQILSADSAEQAVEALNLEDHTFETFTSTGIDDNATSTQLTVSDSGAIVAGDLTVNDSVIINTSDDGVNTLQVGGDARISGNAGFGTESPTEKVDVDGNARIRNENSLVFGGSGVGDGAVSMQYNSATQSLDFNFLGA